MNEASVEYYDHLNCLVEITLTLNRCDKYKSIFLRPSSRCSDLIYVGYLKALDPLTKSVILCSIKDNIVVDNLLVPGQNIRTISKTNLDSGEVALSRDIVSKILAEDTNKKLKECPYYRSNIIESHKQELNVLKRGEDIVSWLTKNRIEAKIDKDTRAIIIANSVRLDYPYMNDSDYTCPTRIVLKRLQKIIHINEAEKIS